MTCHHRLALTVTLLLTVACGPPPAATPPPVTPIAASRPAPEPARASPSAIAERHDLSVDERRGGHTLARHVGRSDDQLRERLRTEPNISAASTYADRDTAEQVIARAFKTSADELARWRERTGRRPNLVLDRKEPGPIGRSLRRNQPASTPCDRAVVVLRWDEQMRSSYVLTSYPECRR